MASMPKHYICKYCTFLTDTFILNKYSLIINYNNNNNDVTSQMLPFFTVTQTVSLAIHYEKY